MQHNEITARIENWFVSAIAPDAFIITGHIYDDVLGRWPDGSAFRSSLVVAPLADQLAEGVVVQTLNSRYLLGQQNTVIR